MLRVRDIDEAELIRRFRSVLPTGERTLLGSGDDCALVAAPEGQFLVTTDILVSGRHFRTDWSSPDQIGERAAAQNLADIAAMGGKASSLVVSLVVPGDIEVDWLIALVQAFGERARRAGAEVVGGDLSGGTEFVIAVTAMGYCPSRMLTRSGAQPGDALAVAGTLGRSAAGLELLSRGLVNPWVRDDPVVGKLVEALDIYRCPNPPLEAGPRAAAGGAHAMMDISDGLLIDAGRMAAASGVVIEIDPKMLASDVEALADAARVCGHNALDWVLGGGEDHGMLAAFDGGAALPDGFTVIGRIRAPGEGEAPALLLDGVEVTGGWDHFKQD